MSGALQSARRGIGSGFPVLAGSLLATIALGLAVPATAAEEAPPRTYLGITFNGFVSAAYSYNFMGPRSHQNALRIFDTADNVLKLDVAELVLHHDAAKRGELGFRVDLTAGSSIPRLTHSAGLETGEFDLQQFFLSYVLPIGSGLKLDAGKFVTSMGYEVIEGYDGYNDNYSRSYLFGYAIPFTHTGLRATYKASDRVSAMLMLVNGWDNTTDSNRAKSVCGQLALTPRPGLSLYANYMIGAEKPSNTSDLRQIFDVVATWAINDRWTVGLNADLGTEARSAAGARRARWTGIAGYLRLNLSEHVSIALRGEVFDDRDGVRIGLPGKVGELTLTPEFRPTPHMIVRWELRWDSSSRAFFDHGTAATDDQVSTSVDLIYKF